MQPVFYTKFGLTDIAKKFFYDKINSKFLISMEVFSWDFMTIIISTVLSCCQKLKMTPTRVLMSLARIL